MKHWRKIKSFGELWNRTETVHIAANESYPGFNRLLRTDSDLWTSLSEQILSADKYPSIFSTYILCSTNMVCVRVTFWVFLLKFSLVDYQWCHKHLNDILLPRAPYARFQIRRKKIKNSVFQSSNRNFRTVAPFVTIKGVVVVFTILALFPW